MLRELNRRIGAPPSGVSGRQSGTGAALLEDRSPRRSRIPWKARFWLLKNWRASWAKRVGN